MKLFGIALLAVIGISVLAEAADAGPLRRFFGNRGNRERTVLRHRHGVGIGSGFGVGVGVAGACASGMCR